jgi:hypothetical protein
MADEFATIDLGALDSVTGGRYTKGDSDPLRPEAIQAINALKEAVGAGLQAIAATKDKKNAGMMQFVQQLFEKKMGGGKK